MIKFVNIGFYFLYSLTIFNWLGWPFEIRFENTSLNYFFISALCILLPIFLLMKILMSKIESKVRVAFLATSVLSFFCFIVGYFAYTDAIEISQTKSDLSFELVSEIEYQEDFYRLYLTNGGATTSYGLVLRKEFSLVPGLKIVHRVFGKYKASEATMYKEDSKLILIIQPYSDGELVQTEVFQI